MTAQNARDGEGRNALITGASAGIGFALAHVFAANGFGLLLTARRRDRLQALAADCASRYGVGARIYVEDLARPSAPADLLAAIAADNIPVDVLVNNAGYGVSGRCRDLPWEAHRDFLQVLVTAPFELAHRALPSMTARRYGRILNVASVAGMLPGSASHTLYGGAKAMMIKWSEALHCEQLGSGVHVTALCPGLTYSEFHDVNGTRAALNRLPKFLWLTAEQVAKNGYEAVMKNRPISIPGAQYKTLCTLVRLLPAGIARRLGQSRSRVLNEKT